VCAAYDEWDADAVVVEVNQGGLMCETVIHGVDPSVHVRSVSASRGKYARAEPVAALYGDAANAETWERASVFHAAGADLTLLEEQMCDWTAEADWSPDRLDALCWAVSDLRGLDSKRKKRGGLRFETTESAA
jgi:phage terminase large subunit-like protein